LPAFGECDELEALKNALCKYRNPLLAGIILFVQWNLGGGPFQSNRGSRFLF
jgi:hypothetical protein